MEIDVGKLAELFEKTAARSPLVVLMRWIEEESRRNNTGLVYIPNVVRLSEIDPEVAKKTLMQMATDDLIELRPASIGDLAMFSSGPNKEEKAKQDALLCPRATFDPSVIFAYLRLL